MRNLTILAALLLACGSSPEITDDKVPGVTPDPSIHIADASVPESPFVEDAAVDVQEDEAPETSVCHHDGGGCHHVHKHCSE